jgi:hypothetical protein
VVLAPNPPRANLYVGVRQQSVNNIESGQKRVTVVELSCILDFDPAAAVRRIAKAY